MARSRAPLLVDLGVATGRAGLLDAAFELGTLLAHVGIGRAGSFSWLGRASARADTNMSKWDMLRSTRPRRDRPSGDPHGSDIDRHDRHARRSAGSPAAPRPRAAAASHWRARCDQS